MAIQIGSKPNVIKRKSVQRNVILPKFVDDVLVELCLREKISISRGINKLVTEALFGDISENDLIEELQETLKAKRKKILPIAKKGIDKNQ